MGFHANGGGPDIPLMDRHAGGYANGTRTKKPIETKTTSIGYLASGDTSTLAASESQQVLSIDRSTSSSTTPSADPSRVVIKNTGNISIVVMLGYETYVSATADITDADTSGIFIHHFLLPGEKIDTVQRSVISLQMETLTDPVATAGFGDRSLWNLEGTVVDWTAPSTDMYADSGANLAAHVDSPDTSITVDDGDFFRVGDLIQLGDDNATATKLEIMEVTAISTNTLTVTRGLYGSNINDKDAQTDGTDGSVSGANVYFPYFNTRHKYNQYASAGYVQTDETGSYSSRNFFALARNGAGTPQGITPGTACFLFYSAGYQELGMQGINSGTNSGLAVSTLYGFDLTVNGSGLMDSDAMQFTTDSTNVTFGGSTGVIAKIQAVLDAAYYDEASAIFQERVSVGIVGGDIRFTSGSHLTTSAILLAAPSAGETTPFGVGRFPAIGNIEKPVPAMLPAGLDLVTYDPLTYAQSTNLNAIAYERGDGTFAGACRGKLNMETGALSITNAPANANFVYCVTHSNPFSGKIDSSEASRSLGLVAVHANVLNKNMVGKITVELYGA